MVAGQLRSRVRFEAAVKTSDGGGGNAVAWVPECTVWGRFTPERGQERVDGGRLQSSVAGVLRVRSSTETRAIDARHSVVIDGERYQVRAITNPDRRSRFLEMTIERGGAT